MTDSDRILIDAQTHELLFMERRADGRWQPSMTAMEAWREARLRLYRLTPTLYATMTPARVWPVMTSAEATHIDYLLARPWIPEGSAFELPEDIQPAELPALDALFVEMSNGGGPPPQPPGGGRVAAAGAESREAQPSAPPALAALAALAAEPVHVVHTHRWETNPLTRRTDGENLSLLDALWRPALLWTDPFPSRERMSTESALAALALLLAAPEPSAPSAPPTVTRMPKHVAELVIRDAEARGATCPITMEPIKSAEAAVTSCGHVFEGAAIKEWLTTHTTCPQCRQPCAV